VLATAEYAVRELGSIRRRGETLGAELSARIQQAATREPERRSRLSFESCLLGDPVIAR
jgi:hypothetical protein